MPSLFIFQTVFADTLKMKDGSEMKGLVVEQHDDRVILSTENGEVPVLREKIDKILFDDPEQSFMQMGESYEASSQWGEALAYYEKALQVNPNFEEAQKAVVRVRNQFWSKASAGPNDEIEKQQALYDAWDKQRSPEDKFKDQSKLNEKSLRDSLGLALKQKGDWTAVSQVAWKKDASVAGLKIGDRLVAVDGRSLRYLSLDVVREKFLLPRYSTFTLEFERDCTLLKTGREKDIAAFGIQVKLEHQGAVVQSVKKSSVADKAGIKAQDVLVSVNGTSMRYLPLKKLLGVIQSKTGDRATLTVRRSAVLPRK